MCDRNAGQVETYINGFGQGATALPPDFAGDLSLGGELKVYRRALPDWQTLKPAVATIMAAPPTNPRKNGDGLSRRW